MKTYYIINAKLDKGEYYTWDGMPIGNYAHYWSDKPTITEQYHIEQIISYMPHPNFDNIQSSTKEWFEEDLAV